MRFIFLILFGFYIVLFGAVAEERQWPKGDTFLNFLEKNSIPLILYYALSAEDKELTAEIQSGMRYYLLKDEESGEFLQALIPLTEDSQIHVYKKKDGYGFAVIPIVSFQKEQTLALSITNSPYQDIINVTADYHLAGEFIYAFKGSVNFRRDVQKGDKLAIIYERKYRLGRPFGSAQIYASMVETSGKPNYVFLFKDGNYYDDKAREIEGFLLSAPLAYTRISSYFSSGRRHPVLGIVRPHLGVDYAASTGTPVKSAGEGRVIFAGDKGGYGKTVIVEHRDGFKSLYAHLNSISKNAKRGAAVKQGSMVGAVGSTGLSTGPHLHFGLYKNDRAINPLGSFKVTRSVLAGKEKSEFLEIQSTYTKQLHTIKPETNGLKHERFEQAIHIDGR